MKNVSFKEGFTLIELIVVVVIIGIASAIAFPSYLAWLPNKRLKNAARDLYSNMQETRSQAVGQNKDMSIVFDITNNRYYVCDDWGADAAWSTSVGDKVGSGDNNIVRTVRLGGYGSSIQFGSGSANFDVPGGPIAPPSGLDYSYQYGGSALPHVVFNSRGTGSGGYVYFDNEDRDNSYAVGTQTSGVILLRRWFKVGGGGSWK